MCLVLIKIPSHLHSSVCHCLQLDVNNNNCFLFRFYLLHKQEQLLGNYAPDLCNGDLHTTIILFKHTASSHKTDWTLLTQPPVFSYLLCGRVSSLIKFPEGKCSCLRLLEIAINVSIIVYTHYCCLFILFTFILIVLLLLNIFLLAYYFFYAGVSCYIKQYDNL